MLQERRRGLKKKTPAFSVKNDIWKSNGELKSRFDNFEDKMRFGIFQIRTFRTYIQVLYRIGS